MMRLKEDLLKKEVIDPEAKLMGVVDDVIFDSQTFEITDIVVKKSGITESIKSNGENIVPIELIGTIGDKLLIKRCDDL